MLARILVGTDGSVDSRRATAKAALLAERFASDVTVAASAVEHGDSPTPWNSEGLDHEVPAETAEGWARTEVTWLSEQGIDATSKVLRGRASEALSKEAVTGMYDLVVIGHKGRTGSPVPQPGSTAVEMVESCPVPLLIVP